MLVRSKRLRRSGTGLALWRAMNHEVTSVVSRVTFVAAAISFALCQSCASAVTPLGPGEDGGIIPVDDGSLAVTDTPPPACIDEPSSALPLATYIDSATVCTPGSSCARGHGLHVRAIDFRYPCACDVTADPLIDMQLDVVDDATPSPSLTIDGWIMSCVHAGYHATGSGFSFRCGSSLGPRGEIGLLVTDGTGNQASIFLAGPEYCNTVRLTCRPSTMTWGDFDYVCGL